MQIPSLEAAVAINLSSKLSYAGRCPGAAFRANQISFGHCSEVPGKSLVIPYKSRLRSETKVRFYLPPFSPIPRTEDVYEREERATPALVQSETGTSPLHIEMRSHSVQTRLSSLPSPHSTSSTAAPPTDPVILRRVIIDPSAEGAGRDEGLTAILPLLKQCTRCGSQRVRLLLVERPPPVLPPPPSPVVHTPRHHGNGRRLAGGSVRRVIGAPAGRRVDQHRHQHHHRPHHTHPQPPQTCV